MAILFDLGQLVATQEVAEFIGDDKEFARFVWESLNRYTHGDWGVLEEPDIELNEDAIREGGRILASYPIPEEIDIDWEDRIWIITEWGRSYTTIMFPTEY